MNEPFNLSKFEEIIYNTHLKVGRQHKKQPFKYRKNFSSLDDKTKATIKKISFFLKKFPHINIEDFFIAPYKLYTDEDYFDLNYYTTLKATKAYTLYQNTKLYEDPDSQEQLQNIILSLNFIQSFCKENNIIVDNYLKHCPEKIPSFIIHLKEHKVTLYTLLGITNFYTEIKKLDPELLKFILGEEMYNRMDVCKTKLFGSKKALTLINKGVSKIKNSKK